MTLATITAKKTYTFDEYIELKEQADYKSEFQNGEIIALSGGTTDYAFIVNSVCYHARAKVRELEFKAKTCNSEMRIFIEAINEAVFADASITIDELSFYKKNKAITNPSVIFEVLSESTGNYDRGAKFRKYKLLPSFQEYVLIEQDQPTIDVLYKRKNGIWEMTSYIGLDDVLELKSLNMKIPLKDIYEDVLENLHLPQYKIDLD